MKINRAPHIPWMIFVLAATAVASLLFVANFHPQRMPPAFRFFGEKPPDHATIGGTPLGLIFGAVSLAIFVFAALSECARNCRSCESATCSDGSALTSG